MRIALCCNWCCISIAVSRDESELVTGGNDSKLIVWKDVTEEAKIEAANKRQEYILQEQKLSNLIHSKKLLAALKLALNLDRPATVLKIINSEFVLDIVLDYCNNY